MQKIVLKSAFNTGHTSRPGALMLYWEFFYCRNFLTCNKLKIELWPIKIPMESLDSMCWIVLWCLGLSAILCFEMVPISGRDGLKFSTCNAFLPIAGFSLPGRSKKSHASFINGDTVKQPFHCLDPALLTCSTKVSRQQENTYDDTVEAKGNL